MSDTRRFVVTMEISTTDPNDDVMTIGEHIADHVRNDCVVLDYIISTAAEELP